MFHINLKFVSKCCLSSRRTVFQINSLRDISEPAYSQLLKVEGVDNENTSVSATQQPKVKGTCEHMHKKHWEFCKWRGHVLSFL